MQLSCGAMVSSLTALVFFAMLGPVSSTRSQRANRSAWEPPSCEELEPGVPCRKLYKHPQGSTFVGPCPVESMTDADGCAAKFKGKSDAEQCSQIACSKALGVTFKLVCGGSCCPFCWAPDHVVAMDRHTSLEKPEVVPPAPQAPPTCKGARCFKPVCGTGFQEGYVQGNCCYSCVAGR